jgi:hypothetical protein
METKHTFIAVVYASLQGLCRRCDHLRKLATLTGASYKPFNRHTQETGKFNPMNFKASVLKRLEGASSITYEHGLTSAALRNEYELALGTHMGLGGMIRTVSTLFSA